MTKCKWMVAPAATTQQKHKCYTTNCTDNIKIGGYARVGGFDCLHHKVLL